MSDLPPPGRRRRGRRYAVWLALALVVLLTAATLNSFRGRLGWSAAPQTPEALAAQILPAMRWTAPAGDGPFPVALLLSGCDGPQPNLDRLAGHLAAAGWLSGILDSHTPRGLDTAQAWRLVCAGQILNGAERAADIAVALAHLQDRPEADPDRVALIGLSHGGWAVLDFLALTEEGTLPPLLTDWPGPPGRSARRGIRGAMLWYPYCGPAAIGSVSDLPSGLAYRFLLVEDDSIVNERHCLEIAGRLLSLKADVSVTTFSGVTHSFDQENRSALSFLLFDAEATDSAVQSTLDFLGGL